MGVQFLNSSDRKILNIYLCVNEKNAIKLTVIYK